MSYLRLKCTKFDFGWSSAQTPLGERTPQDYLTGSEGSYKGREGQEKEETWEGREGEGGKGEGCVMAFGGMDAPLTYLFVV